MRLYNLNLGCLEIHLELETCPCNTCIYPLYPTFMLQNWGIQGYAYFFLFLIQNTDCGYSLELPWRGSNVGDGSNV